ncbi:MAG: hypothetical protein Q9227_004876 [Pyrenula ochraceoflavens]
MTQHDVLYSADPATLPAELPTVEEIHLSEDVLSERSRCKVVGVGDQFVVKYGFGVNQLEGETMIFLRHLTTLPVPIIYTLFQIPEAADASLKKTYLVMERIRGESLEKVWSKLDTKAKETVVSKLRKFFDEIRRLSSPGGYCSLGGHGLPDDIFWDEHHADEAFKTETDLNIAIIERCLKSGVPKYRKDFYSRAFNTVLQNHPPTFSHGDIQKKNILIRCNDKGELDLENLEMKIIDWESAGWYPSYWDYSRAVFACGPWEDDWSVWIDRFLEPAFNECAWTMIYLEECW